MIGGGERLVLSMGHALREAGHDVTLATIQGVNWAEAQRVFGMRREVQERRLISLPALLPYTYQIPLSLTRFQYISREYDLTINTQGESVPAPADILYLQGGFMFTIRRHSDIYDYWRSIYPWWHYAAYRAYFTPYSWFFDRKLDATIESSSTLLTNSAYSARIVELETGHRPEVLYPPVDIERFATPPYPQKDRLVVTVGRFSPDKKLEIIPRVARLCPDYVFCVVGTVTSKVSLDKFRKEIAASGVSNVRIIVNAPISELRELYSRAKFYLHTKPSECFGITVVEGMSASCVPIVPKSGGPWSDIVEGGKYGLGYSDDVEAADLINGLDDATCEKMRTLAVERSRSFSYSVFKNGLLAVVDGMKEDQA